MKLTSRIILGDNLFSIKELPSASFDLIYIDPPFNTGKKQVRDGLAYADDYQDYIKFLEPRLREGYRLLKSKGSFFLHLDYREVHYAKVLMDKIFGRQSFINEIIWAYDYGARSKSRWSAKHDNILWYAKDPKDYVFNYNKIDRIPYMSFGLVGEEKQELGKTPTDCWWHTIVGTNSAEKNGYPTQKPLNLMDRLVKVHSNPNDVCLDFFAGSGTFGEACLQNRRECILVDSNPQAISLIKKRLRRYLGDIK